MFRNIFVTADLYFCWRECKLAFDCLCLLPFRTDFMHETIWSLTCANFKSWKSKRNLKLMMMVGLPSPLCLTHTHIHTDRGVNCQSNEWSRNVFQSSGGARTGLSSSHNNADIYASLWLKQGTWTSNRAPRVLCSTTSHDRSRRQ